MLSVSLIRYKNEAPKKIVLQKSENRQVTRFTILIFPHIHCCVRIKVNPVVTAYLMKIFSHRFLGSDCISFKTFAFLAVY